MTTLLAPSTFRFLTDPSQAAAFMSMQPCVPSHVVPLRSQTGLRGLCLRSTGLQQRRCCASAVSGSGHTAGDSTASVVETREHGKNGKLMTALEKRGIQRLELPLIEHRDGPDLPQLVQTLRDVKFEWIIVTSPEAATVFLRAWKKAGCPKVRIAVVGAGTGQNAEQGSDLLEVAFTPSKATAKVLASELPKFSDGDNHVLYPASLKTGDDLATGLTERGFHVLRMNTYSSTVRNLDEAAIAAAAAAPVATFASPTAVKAWMELVAGPRNWDGAAACLVCTSANAASKAGLQKIYHPQSWNRGVAGEHHGSSGSSTYRG